MARGDGASGPGSRPQSTMCTGQRPFSGSLASILGFSSPKPGSSPSETAPKPTRAACRRSGAPRLTWNRPGGGEALPRYITDSVGASGEALPPAAPVLGRVARRPSTPARPHSTSSTRRAGRGGKVSSRGAQGPRPGARPGARGTGSRIRAEVGEREREVPGRAVFGACVSSTCERGSENCTNTLCRNGLLSARRPAAA